MNWPLAQFLSGMIALVLLSVSGAFYHWGRTLHDEDYTQQSKAFFIVGVVIAGISVFIRMRYIQ